MGVKIVDNNRSDEVYRNAAEINRRAVEAGYITGGDYAGGQITIKGLARVHEYGCDITVTDKMRGFLSASFDVHLRKETKVIRIPERSFIRTGSREGEEPVMQQVKAFIASALLGETDVYSLYEIIGNAMREAIKAYGHALQSPANAALTQQIKGGSNPLVYSGAMLDGMEVLVV